MKNLVAALTLNLVDRLSRPSRIAVGAIGQIERAQKMAADGSAQWTRGLDRLDSRLNRLASASLVTDGLGRAGEAMIRPLRRAITEGAAFEQAMTGIGITAQMTDRQLQPVRRSILQTATDLGALPSVVQGAFSSVLAEGVYRTEAELIAAGRSVSRFQRLAATMKDPISGEEAGGLSAGLARSFNIRADQLDQANAMINRAAQRGGVSIGVQARFLPASAASMRGLGGANDRGLADVLAATQIAKASAGGSEQAANNLANLLAAITSPETLKNFSKMGVDLEKEIKGGITRGISPLETVATVTARLSKGGDQFRLGQLFGDRQARDGAMALVQNLDQFRQISEDLRSKDALSAYMADLDRALQGPAASFDRYQSSMARAGIATGTILAPAAGLAAGLLGKVANWMSRASESGSTLAKVAVWAVAGVAGLAVGAGMLGHAVVGVLGPLYIMQTLLGKDGLGGGAAKQAIAWVIGGFGRMRMAALAFNLSMLANPVVLGIAAVVAAVIIGAVIVRKYWQPISAFFTGVGQALGEAFGPALGAVGGALRPLKPLWDGLTGAVGRFFGWVGRLLTPMQATQGQLTGATNAGRRFGQALVFAFNISPIGLFIRGIRGLFQLAGFFNQLVARFRGWGGDIVRGLVSGLLGSLGVVGGAIGQIANATVNGFRQRLGIRSPSRVFAGLGDDTMAGLSLGLRRGQGGPVAMVAGVAGAMAATMAAAQVPASTFSPASGAPQAAVSGMPGRSMTIGDITVHVTVQGGAGDARQQGRQVGRAAADAIRARLFDGLD